MPDPTPLPPVDADDDRRSHQIFAGIEEPRNTRERILFVATDLFYTHGFHAVGLDQILAEAKLTKTTFYKYFASREDLIEAAIQLRDEWESAAFTKALHERAGYDPKALLLAFFDVLHEWFTGPTYRGCLFLMALMDYPHRAHPVHQAGANHYLISRTSVEQMASAAGIADPKSFAEKWAVLIVGAVGQQLIDPDQQPALSAKAIADMLLREALP